MNTKHCCHNHSKDGQVKVKINPEIARFAAWLWNLRFWQITII